MTDQQTALALKCLNDAVSRDPVAIAALLRHRVPCTKALADHPTIEVAWESDTHSRVEDQITPSGVAQVDAPVMKEQYSVGAFGLLVGVLRAIGLPTLCYELDGGKVVGFSKYQFLQERDGVAVPDVTGTLVNITPSGRLPRIAGRAD